MHNLSKVPESSSTRCVAGESSTFADIPGAFDDCYYFVLGVRIAARGIFTRSIHAPP